MSLFFFYAVFIVCVVSHYDTEIMTLKRMLAESAVEKYKNNVGFCNPCGAFCNF